MALLKQAPSPFITELEQRITLSAAKLWGVQLAAAVRQPAGEVRERRARAEAAAQMQCANSQDFREGVAVVVNGRDDPDLSTERPGAARQRRGVVEADERTSRLRHSRQ